MDQTFQCQRSEAQGKRYWPRTGPAVTSYERIQDLARSGFEPLVFGGVRHIRRPLPHSHNPPHLPPPSDKMHTINHGMSRPHITYSMWPVQPRETDFMLCLLDRAQQRQWERQATSSYIINILWLTIITGAQTRTTDSFIISSWFSFFKICS